MARSRRRKSKWRGIGYLLLAALTLVVAGFIVRHDIGPGLFSLLTGRPAAATKHGAAAPSAPLSIPAKVAERSGRPYSASARPAQRAAGEELTPRERRALSGIIRERAK